MRSILVTFAVPLEAKYFVATRSASPLITGIGPINAANALRNEIKTSRPDLILTCGFAGGLAPDLKHGDIIYDCDSGIDLKLNSPDLRARSGQIHCSRKIAATAVEKQIIRDSRRADAVEMESGVIRKMANEAGIPSATIRVISDTATENLPLNFNDLMTREQTINYRRLFARLATSPSRVVALMKFRKQISLAARRLGETLSHVLSALNGAP